jgi:hypothetical protein
MKFGYGVATCEGVCRYHQGESRIVSARPQIVASIPPDNRFPRNLAPDEIMHQAQWLSVLASGEFRWLPDRTDFLRITRF